MQKKSAKKSIGVFDSGFGGLHILRGIVKELPEYDYVYLADTARVPYGNRSKDVVYSFTKQAVDFLFAKGCDMVILACNTASSEALRKIQQEHLPKHHPEKKVLGVLIPAAECAVDSTENRKIGLMATEGTIASRSFSHEIPKRNPHVKLFINACPLLVPFIESGEYNSKPAEMVLRKYLKPLTSAKVDTIVLGCTHYGIIESQIRRIVGKNVNIVSEAKIVPKKLRDYLERHPEIEKNIGKKSSRTFYSTDLTPRFKKLGSKFFGQKIKVKKAQLD